MRSVLIGIVMVIGLVVFLFGGSLPSSYQELRSGQFNLQVRPMINIGPMFEGKNSQIFGN